jgi:protein TonB
MFDLITGKATHMPRHQGVPIVVSTAAQVLLVGLVIVVPLLFVTHQLPAPPVMMAFVAAPPPPPPPPPPAAPASAAKTPPASTTAAPTQSTFVAPIEAPASVAPEPPGEDAVGVPGGVEGGVPGGVVGGIVGGLPEAPPPPPPPPPPPQAPKGPVRIGGQIQPPTLLHRVEPAYPPMAVSAHLQGVVILEAIVDEGGIVKEVRVLRSVNPLLDKEALSAVRQWRYSPVVLNGIPVPFILSVSLSFSLQEKG